MRAFIRVAAVIILTASVGWLGFRELSRRVPPNWIPWADVDLDQEPSVFAKWQIGRLSDDPEACFAALDRSELEYRRLPDRSPANGCGVAARTNIVKSHIRYSSGFESPCALTAALYWYEQRLNALAEAQLGTTIERIEHFGTYACRNIYGRAETRLSAHARARAIDVGGFRLKDGSAISVLDNWEEETPKGRFLKAARDEACRFFGIVLSPDYNTAHGNHLHLELGRFRLCR